MKASITNNITQKGNITFENNTLGNFYEFTLYKADGELVQAAQHKLENLHQSNIDPSEIPEDSL